METNLPFFEKIARCCHGVGLFVSSFYFKLRSLLVTHEGFKVSHFFSHGGFHIIVGIGIAWLAWGLYSYTTRSTKPVYKKMTIKTRCTPYSPMESFYCDFFMGGILRQQAEIYQNMEIVIKYERLDSLQPVYDKDSIVTKFRTSKFSYTPLRCPALPEVAFSREVTLEVSSPTSGIELFSFGDKKIKKNKSIDRYNSGISLGYIDSLRDNYISYKVYHENHDGFIGVTQCLTGDLVASVEEENNPYLCFYMEIDAFFPSLRDTEDCGDCMKIKFIFANDDTLKKIEVPINIINIYPQPTKVTPGSIEYSGKTKFMEIGKNGGIYFLIEDLNKKATSDRKVYLYTILLGGALAFLLDIIVNLIIKWRNLSEKEFLPHPYSFCKNRKRENINNQNKTGQRYYESIEE